MSSHVVDLEQREDAAKTEKENDEMAAKNLQAEVNVNCRLCLKLLWPFWKHNK